MRRAVLWLAAAIAAAASVAVVAIAAWKMLTMLLYGMLLLVFLALAN